jgi:hypothetical protein
MGKPIDDRVKKILKELDFDPKQCLWDCHNTWVMYHRYIEQAGAMKKIEYDLTEIETNSAAGVVCIKCTASIGVNGGKAKCITYGEASPKNTKNSYPYAMAEKRAIDRAILKLLGLHGFIYSEDEMDLSQTNKQKIGPSDDEALGTFEEQIKNAANLKVLKGYGTMYKVAMAKAKKSSPAIYQHVKTLYEEKLTQLQNGKEQNAQSDNPNR